MLGGPIRAAGAAGQDTLSKNPAAACYLYGSCRNKSNLAMNRLAHDSQRSIPPPGRGTVVAGTLSGDGCIRSPEAEISARAEIEQRCGYPLADKEWLQQRSRLVEFFRTLVRWDAEQRARS